MAARKLLMKPLLWAAFWLTVTLLLAFNAALVWVATGSRSLERALPYIENALTPPESPYRVRVAQAMLLWDGWQHPLDIRLKQVELRTAQGDMRVAVLPDVSLGVDLLALLTGRVRPTSFIVRKAALRFVRGDDGGISFGVAPPEAQEESAPGAEVPLLAAVDAFFRREGSFSFSRLKRVEVRDAVLRVVDVNGNKLLEASQLRAQLKRGRNASLNLSATVFQQRGAARLQLNLEAEGKAPGAKAVNGRVQAQNLYPATLAPLVNAEIAGWLNGFDMPLSGWISGARATPDAPPAWAYLLNFGNGVIRTSHLDGEVKAKGLQVEGIARGYNDFTLRRFLLDMGEPKLSGAGRILLDGEDTAIEANLTATRVPVQDMRLFWPPALSPMSREWVMTNVTGGTVPQATLKANIKKGDLRLPNLPQEAIDAVIRFQHAEIHHMPGHPPLRELEGSVHVDGLSLTGDVARGTYLTGTRIAQSKLEISDLNADNPLIRLTLQAQSPAADIVDFLSRPPADHAAHLKLAKEKVSGTVTGNATLGFYFVAPRDAKGRPREDMGVEYDVDAKIEQGAAEGFMGRFDISAANGNMRVNNKGLTFSGSGSVNGATASKAEVRYLFTPQDGFDTFITATARAPVSALKRFGVPEIPALERGAFGVNADIRMGDKKERMTINADLKDTALSIKEIQWGKPEGISATVMLKTSRDTGLLTIDELHYTSGEEEAIGSMGLDEAQSFSTFSFSTLRLGKNDLALDYGKIPGGWRLKAVGAAADVRPWTSGAGDDFRFSAIPALDITLDVKRMIIANERELEAVKGVIQCSNVLCGNVNVAGRAGKGAFSIRIGRGQGGRAMEVKAEDAGGFLRSLDIYDGMRGGALALSGAFDDAKPTHPLKGKLTVSTHTIENAPILAKLLSLASIIGIPDLLLGGGGIAFEQLIAPFTLENDVITLTEAKTYGASIGLTAEGTITFPGKRLEINGAVAPANTINRIIGSVPLVGDVLTGGGEGIIAARYTVTGKPSDPNVSVNPLSVLTPGFLRGIFNVFDKKESKSQAP